MLRRLNSVNRVFWPAVVTLYAMLLTSLHMAMTSPWRLATPVKLANFEAVEPFQYRVLLPAIVAAIHELLPLGIVLLFALAEVATWILLIVLAEQALRLFDVGSSTVVRRMLALTVVIPVGLHLIVPELVPYPVVDLEQGVLDLGNWRAHRLFHYVYDLPAATFTLALVLLMVQYARTRERRWLLGYLALFAVATVNRETTMLLIPAFALGLYGLIDNRTLVRAIAVQLASVVIIQGILQLWLFTEQPNANAAVPGTQYENHLLNNLALFVNPFYLLTFMARFAAGLYLPAILFRRHLDPFLARTLVCFGVPLLISAFAFGRIVEQRVFIELIPLVWLAGIQALAAYNASRRPAGRSIDVAPAVGTSGVLPARHARTSALRLGYGAVRAGQERREMLPQNESGRSAVPTRRSEYAARRRRRARDLRTPTRSRPPASLRPDDRRWTP